MAVVGDEVVIPIGGVDRKARVNKIEGGNALFDIFDDVGNKLMSTAGKLPEGPKLDPAAAANLDKSLMETQAQKDLLSASSDQKRADALALNGDPVALRDLNADPAAFAESRIQDPMASAVPVPVAAPLPVVAPVIEGGQPSVTPQVSIGGGAFDKGIAAQKSAINQEVKFGQSIANINAAAQQEIVKINENRLLEQKTMQEAADKQLAERLAKKTEAEESLKDWKPQDFWASKSAGQKVGLSLSIALGAIGQGLMGAKENAVLSSINADIERDTRQQQMEFSRRKDVLEGEKSAYGELYKILGDKDLAANRLHMAKIGQVQQQLAAKVAGMGSEQAKVNGAKLMAELQTQADKLEADYGIKQNELLAKKLEAQKGMQENLIPALGIYATTKEGAAKMNELAGSVRSSQDGIGQLLQLSSEGAGKSISPEMRAKAETIATALRAELRVPILGPGTVQEREYKLLERLVADPTAVFSLDSVNRVRLKQLSERLEAGLQQKAKAYAVPGSEGINTGTINVRLPDGREGPMPTDKVQAALALGAEIIK